jgi:hypothetical protein
MNDQIERKSSKNLQHRGKVHGAPARLQLLNDASGNVGTLREGDLRQALLVPCAPYGLTQVLRRVDRHCRRSHWGRRPSPASRRTSRAVP